MKPRRPLVLATCLLGPLACAPTPAFEARDLEDCERRLAEQPSPLAADACYRLSSRASHLARPVAEALDQASRARPEDPWLHLYRGRALFDLGGRGDADSDPSLLAFRKAVELFSASSPEGRNQDDEALFEARYALAVRLGHLSRREAMETEIETLEASAHGDGSDGGGLRRAAVLLLRAELIYRKNHDLGRAYRLLLDAEAEIFQGGDTRGEVGPVELARALREAPLEAGRLYRLGRSCLFQLSRIGVDLGRYQEADAYDERLIAWVRAYGDSYQEVTALSSRLSTLSGHLEPGEENRQRLLGLARETAEAARKLGNREAEEIALFVLGLYGDGGEAISALEACLATPSWLDDSCRIALAGALVDSDPERARALVETFRAGLSAPGEDPWGLLYNWSPIFRLAWASEPPLQALETCEEIFEALEILRGQEAQGQDRAEKLVPWIEAFYWLAGRLLEAHGEGGGERRELIDAAFAVQERMRARVLRERLGAFGADDSSLLLERAVSLPTLEAELAPHEALLAFQIDYGMDLAGKAAGGSWAMASTHAGSRAYRLPHDRSVLEGSSVRGLLDLEDPEEAPQLLAALYEALLAPALEGLPDTVEHLILVPDGEILRLPFPTLRPLGGKPLMERYRLTLSPSATLWYHLRQRPADRDAAPAALVFADPLLPEDAAQAGGGQLAPLSHARAEGATVHGLLGGKLLIGPEAAESRLAAARRTGQPLPRLLHFAAHSIASEDNPQRSAVLLAAGGGQDGRLEPKEIAALSLTDRVVVLSACETAAGNLVRGEGILSLAQAFLEAGAQTVVASHHRLEDEEAAELASAFTRSLAEGRSVAEALSEAQRRRRAAGAPASGWGQMLVLGNGAFVPFPRP